MKVQEIEIPDDWCAALVKLKAFDPDAFIAGGAIRDLYFGVAPKDVDFFSTRIPDWTGAIESTFDYQGMLHVLDVFEYERKPINFNLILMHEGISCVKMISTFDFGICQIAFDGTNIITTPNFLWDAKHSLFTLRQTDRYKRSIKRFCRISQRYPDWNIAIPQLDPPEVTKEIYNG